MEEQFNKSRPPSAEYLDLLWQNASFVFDTNVLLDLYTHSTSTRQSFLDALNVLASRLFLPHQVVVEFARHREGKIRDAKNSFDKALDYVDDWEDAAGHQSKLEGQINNLKVVREGVRQFDYLPEELASVVEQAADDIREKIESNRSDHPVLGEGSTDPDDDDILQKLFNIFDGKTGEAYSPERYNEIIDESEIRGERGIPPGYSDIGSKPGDHQYGDQLIWNQMVDHAKVEDVDMVFVTGDSTKGDWFREEDGYKEPRDGLWREFRRRTGQQFWMLTPSHFLEQAKDHFDIGVSEDSIEEAADSPSATQRANIAKLEEQFDPLFEQGVIDPKNLDDAREQLMLAWTSHEIGKASDLAFLLSRVYSKYEDITGDNIFDGLSSSALEAASRLKSIPNSKRAKDHLYYLEEDIRKARKVLKH